MNTTIRLIRQVIGPKYQLEYVKDISNNFTGIILTNRCTQQKNENWYSPKCSATSQFSFEKMADLVRGIENE